MLKRFLDWIGLKEKLHKSSFKPPLVKERDLWWASIGENVGSEINGKSDLIPYFFPRKSEAAANAECIYSIYVHIYLSSN
jgi:hypothetical protein